MKVLGIDPGLSGALAIVGDDHSCIYEVMPVHTLKKTKKGKAGKSSVSVTRKLDIPAIVRWLQAHKPEIQICFLEQPGYRPGQSVQSGATVGRNFGIIEGVLTALGIPFEIVPPQVWGKVMHAGLDQALDSKSRSILAACRLFPGFDLRASDKCKGPHDGIAEALLLASYGHRVMNAS